MPHLVVRSSHPCQDIAGISVQVSSHFYQCSLVHCNRQIHEDLEVPFFADHFRFLTERFDPKLADTGKPVVRQLSIYLCWQIVDHSVVKRTKGGRYRESCRGFLPRGGHVETMNRT